MSWWRRQCRTESVVHQWKAVMTKFVKINVVKTSILLCESAAQVFEERAIEMFDCVSDLHGCRSPPLFLVRLEVAPHLQHDLELLMAQLLNLVVCVILLEHGCRLQVVVRVVKVLLLKGVILLASPCCVFQVCQPKSCTSSVWHHHAPHCRVVCVV